MTTIFHMVDTKGMPLTEVVEFFYARGLAVKWDDFTREARKAGWSDKTIKSRICEALTDVYGNKKDWSVEVDSLLGAM